MLRLFLSGQKRAGAGDDNNGGAKRQKATTEIDSKQKDRKPSDPISNLPQEIFRLILANLRVDAILSLSQTNKLIYERSSKWLKTISERSWTRHKMKFWEKWKSSQCSETVLPWVETERTLKKAYWEDFFSKVSDPLRIMSFLAQHKITLDFSEWSHPMLFAFAVMSGDKPLAEYVFNNPPPHDGRRDDERYRLLLPLSSFIQGEITVSATDAKNLYQEKFLDIFHKAIGLGFDEQALVEKFVPRKWIKQVFLKNEEALCFELSKLRAFTEIQEELIAQGKLGKGSTVRSQHRSNEYEAMMGRLLSAIFLTMALGDYAFSKNLLKLDAFEKAWKFTRLEEHERLLILIKRYAIASGDFGLIRVLTNKASGFFSLRDFLLAEIASLLENRGKINAEQIGKILLYFSGNSLSSELGNLLSSIQPMLIGSDSHEDSTVKSKLPDWILNFFRSFLENSDKNVSSEKAAILNMLIFRGSAKNLSDFMNLCLSYAGKDNKSNVIECAMLLLLWEKYNAVCKVDNTAEQYLSYLWKCLFFREDQSVNIKVCLNALNILSWALKQKPLSTQLVQIYIRVVTELYTSVSNPNLLGNLAHGVEMVYNEFIKVDVGLFSLEQRSLLKQDFQSVIAMRRQFLDKEKIPSAGSDANRLFTGAFAEEQKDASDLKNQHSAYAP